MSLHQDEAAGLPLFDAPLVELPMTKRGDIDECRDSAEKVAPFLGKIQREVLEAIRELGPMTAREGERLKRFEGRYGYSTVRKRFSELYLGGYLDYVPDEPGPVYCLHDGEPEPRTRDVCECCGRVL
jgi:hypothetical protein